MSRFKFLQTTEKKYNFLEIVYHFQYSRIAAVLGLHSQRLVFAGKGHKVRLVVSKLCKGVAMKIPDIIAAKPDETMR